MTYWKTEHFEALQKLWYKRLEEAGFQDAEQLRANEMLLKQRGDHPLTHAGLDELAREHKAAYYTLLQQMVREWKFANEVDQWILEMYADGIAIKQICRILNEAGESRCRGTVRFVVRKYEMKWGLRVYTARQLNVYRKVV